MAKIKNKEEKRKVSPQRLKDKRGSGCDQYPAFSFRYLTTNKGYNFEYFKDENDKKIVMLFLVERMKEITATSYLQWSGKSKNCGNEMLEFWQINVKPNALELSKAEKVIVFRFFQQKYRALCIRQDRCPILYVIGFDFNHTAYHHGS